MIDEQNDFVKNLKKKIWYCVPVDQFEMLFLLKHFEVCDMDKNSEKEQNKSIVEDMLVVYNSYPQKRKLLLDIINNYCDIDVKYKTKTEPNKRPYLYFAGYTLKFKDCLKYKHTLHTLANQELLLNK